MRTAMKDRAATIVASNWRIRRRLPKITGYARLHGFITGMSLDEWTICTDGANVTRLDNGNVLVVDSHINNHSELYTLTDYRVYEDHAGYVSLRPRNRNK